MNTSKKINKPIVKLLCDISDPELMSLALNALLSDKELDGVENRLQIFRLLEKGATQRDIASELGVGIATVTRGARFNKSSLRNESLVRQLIKLSS